MQHISGAAPAPSDGRPNFPHARDARLAPRIFAQRII
jgi:hypothetical protein